MVEPRCPHRASTTAPTSASTSAPPRPAPPPPAAAPADAGDAGDAQGAGGEEVNCKMQSKLARRSSSAKPEELAKKQRNSMKRRRKVTAFSSKKKGKRKSKLHERGSRATRSARPRGVVSGRRPKASPPCYTAFISSHAPGRRSSGLYVTAACATWDRAGTSQTPLRHHRDSESTTRWPICTVGRC